MASTNYTTMSDAALEAKRNEIQLQIEALRANFKALGLEQERRRQTGESVKDYPELKAEIARLQSALNAQQQPQPFWKRWLGGS